MDELEDADSADILTEISRGVDKWLWFVEAHQQGENGGADAAGRKLEAGLVAACAGEPPTRPRGQASPELEVGLGERALPLGAPRLHEAWLLVGGHQAGPGR